MDSLKKSKSLLKSAKDLLEKDDLAGVAGLAYQAVEAGIKVLAKDERNHASRRKKAEEILKLSEKTLNSLWSARNIDFYGNESIGGEDKELTKDNVTSNKAKAPYFSMEMKLFEV